MLWISVKLGASSKVTNAHTHVHTHIHTHTAKYAHAIKYSLQRTGGHQTTSEGVRTLAISWLFGSTVPRIQRSPWQGRKALGAIGGAIPPEFGAGTLMQIVPNRSPDFSQNTAQNSAKHAVSIERFIFFGEGPSPIHRSLSPWTPHSLPGSTPTKPSGSAFASPPEFQPDLRLCAVTRWPIIMAASYGIGHFTR